MRRVGSGFGRVFTWSCLVTIVLGFIGALLGTWLARVTGLPELFAINIGGHTFPIIWSIIGGALFAAVLGLLTRRRTIVD